MRNKKPLMNILLMFVLLLAGSITYSCYDHIVQAASDSIDMSEVHNLVTNYAHYYNYILNMELNGYSIDQYLMIEGDEVDELVEAINSYNDIFNSYADSLEDETEIYYYAQDTLTHTTLSNTDDNLSLINNDNNLQNKYIYYIQFAFDEEGNMTVNFSNDESLNNFSFDDYDGYNTTDTYYDNNQEGTITFTSPTNMIVTYAVSSDMILSSRLSGYSSNIEIYFRFALPYIAFMTLAMMLITLITPMKYLNESSILAFVSRIKFGILAFIWCVLLDIMINIGGRVVVLCTLRDEWNAFLEYFSISQIGPYFIPIINVIFWMCFYFLFMVLAYMIKYLFHKGIMRYAKENTLISWLIIQFKKIIQYVLTFNFHDHMNKVIIKILLINLLVLILCSLLNKFAIILAIIYTLIVFYVLHQKAIDVQQDYNTLLKATKQLSLGSFDIDIHEDLGMFNPLKEEYGHIKDGFQIAVDNEVKSQKMKTELISNVSHDLKTPLTAMITYIDLLKNNDEHKEEYIQILERNALRLKHLIEDLFDISKASSGDIQLDLIDIDIISIIKEAQLECQDYLDERQLFVKYQIPENKIILHLDSLKTFRIFENLFMNISKYALSHTRVYIEVIESDTQVKMIMKNISEEEMNFNGHEITERFIQGDKSRHHDGSGLGLAIVKSFTEIQNGEFYIELDGDLFKSTIIFNK